MDKALKNQEEEKQITFFQRFIYWFLIPLLFAIFIGVLIASVAGVNVFEQVKEWSEKIPLVQKESNEENISEYEQKIIHLDAEIENKEAQISQLQVQLDNKDLKIEEQIKQQEELQKQINELQQIKDEQRRAFKEVVSTYEAMSPKSVAPIILEMDEKEALKILSNISTESLAKIMEKMPPKDAAKFFEMMSVDME
nr:hypothetical protein [Paenibacillus bovis]